MEGFANLPNSFKEVRYSGAMAPGVEPDTDLAKGANCQRFAYAVLAHFGLIVPNFRSSELWDDSTFTQRVDEPEYLDLVLFSSSGLAWGAHVGLCANGNEVLHLCREVGYPTIWSIKEFDKRERYQTLVGYKRVRG